MRVITENSVYQVKPVDGGFEVQRIASTRNDRPVREKYKHFTTFLHLNIGGPLVTTRLRTTEVLAIRAA